MDSRPVVITEQDMRRIRRVLDAAKGSALGSLVFELTRSLERAVHVRSECIRADVVTLDSQVSVEDPDTGCLNQYTLILPGDVDADPGVEPLSVLAPLGWNILGRREGELVQFRVPGSGSRLARIKRIDFQPEADEAHGRTGRAFDQNGAHPQDAMHPEYPLERLCSHLYEPFQLNFARHAEQMLQQEQAIEVEATHRGLVMRGETEAALEHCAQRLQDYFGNQIRVGPAMVRYHNGTTLEEPYMGLRVRCSPEHFEAIKSDLNARAAQIVSSESTATSAVIRASVPLAKLLGFGWSLAKLTSGTAHECMWLSHYAPIEPPPPDDAAAQGVEGNLGLL